MSENAALPARRRPLQARATLRQSNFLDAAASLIADLGYDGVTMTAIASKAGASIGTLYDYFPDKQSITTALLARYAQEGDLYWDSVLADHENWTQSATADLFVDAAMKFALERPDYLFLLDAPIAYSRDADGRQPLRSSFVTALRRLNDNLPAERALIGANIVVELVKCFLNTQKRTEQSEKNRVSEDFKSIIKLYISNVLA